MRTAPYLLSIILLTPPCVLAQADTGPAADVKAVHNLINRYTQAVDTLDPNLLSQIWSHSPETSFIYPLGEERGFDAIRQNVFQNVMGAMFSTRKLQTRDVSIHVYGNAAWSQFHWEFHATLRKDNSAITTRGVETQIYRKEQDVWRIVHIHYSEDRAPETRQPAPSIQ